MQIGAVEKILDSVFFSVRIIGGVNAAWSKKRGG